MAGRNLFADAAPVQPVEAPRGRNLFADTQAAPTTTVEQDVLANRQAAMQEGQLNTDGSAVIRQDGTSIPFGEPTGLRNDPNSQGFLASQQQAPVKKLQLPPKTESVGRETVRSLLRGATIGASDVAGAGLGALGYKGLEAVGAVPESGQSIGELYTEMKTKQADQRDAFREEQPMLAYGSEIAGAVAPAVLTLGASAPASTASTVKAAAPLGMRVLKGSAIGAGQGGVYGATQADVGEELQGGAEGALFGGAVGAAFPMLGAGIKRMISPNASVNPQLQALKASGVQPTVGQALGGLANDIEQKLTSLPIAGKKIADQRYNAVKQYNEGVINEVLAPIGQKVQGAGFEAVKEAGDKAGQAYQNALGKINGVMFDDTFNSQVGELRGLVANLSEDQAKRFEKIYANEVNNRISSAGGMIPEAYKKADSALGGIAANASDKELGSAVKQLQALLKDQMKRSNPDVAGELEAADTAWSMLVRLEDASKRAVNTDGIFTPAQLSAAIKAADKSTRKRSVARGEAVLQDTARAGQSVLGNTVPDSGTMGRLALGGSLMGGSGVAGLSGVGVAPAIGVATGLGALRGAYSTPAKNFLTDVVSKRGANAPITADRLNMLLSADATRRAALTGGGGD